jgi:hypothetical protein
MIQFRSKIADILVNSELNDDSIRNQDLKDDEGDTDPTALYDCGRPPKNIKPSNTSSKVEPISQSLFLSPFVNPTYNDLIDELCIYINMVDDVFLLE